MVDIKDTHIIPKEEFPEGIVRFFEKHGAGNYLKLFLKLNYQYLMSPTRKTWDVYDRDRQFEFEQIRNGIISELKFERAAGIDTTDKLTEGCFGLYDTVYIASEMIFYTDTRDLNQFLLTEIRVFEKGDRVCYFKSVQDSEGMKKILVKLNRILKEFGLARLSIDDKMICPFCAIVWDKLEIFKHSCGVSDDLTINRGRRQ